MAGTDLGDAGPEVEPDAVLLEDLGRVVTPAADEHPEQAVRMVGEMDDGLADREVAVLGREGPVDHLSERPGDLDARRASADDDELDRALVDERRIPVGLLEELEDPAPEPYGVIDRVERE